MTLKRPRNRIIGGVCAGIANFLGWDVAMVRTLYLLLTILTAFSGGVIYLILWVVMPSDDSRSLNR